MYTTGGPLCEWKATLGSSPEGSSTFTAFAAVGLTRACEDEDEEPAVLVWKPDENTPHTVYYQVS